MSDDLHIFTPCFYDRPFEQLYKYMIASAAKQGVPLHYYGQGETYPGWIAIKLSRAIDYLNSINNEYVLYTDSGDAFFTGSLHEIWQKYDALDRPDMLVAATKHMFPHEADISLYDETLGDYRYPHVGGYIGNRLAIIEVLTRMVVIAKEHNWGDDANCWHQAYKDGWFRPAIDNECWIFQLTDDNDLSVINRRFYNKTTDSYPCIMHVSGGYNDTNNGKLAAVKPWYEKMYGELL